MEISQSSPSAKQIIYQIQQMTKQGYEHSVLISLLQFFALQAFSALQPKYIETKLTNLTTQLKLYKYFIN